MRTVQAAGPYFLCGHSYGGLVALEIANQLLQAKEKVACLVMLDSPGPEGFKAKASRHAKKLLTVSLGENLEFYYRRLFLASARRWTSRATTMMRHASRLPMQPRGQITARNSIRTN